MSNSCFIRPFVGKYSVKFRRQTLRWAAQHKPFMTSHFFSIARTFGLVFALASHFTVAFAQDERGDLVRRIIVAQGLLEIFDQQIAQQKEATQAYANKMFEEGVRQAGGQPNDRERAAFERLVVRSSAIFTPDELVRAWAAEYGKELTTQELSLVLRYYESPIGRKDVAASKSALTRFSTWAAEQGQARTSALIADFAEELKSARQ